MRCELAEMPIQRPSRVWIGVARRVLGQPIALPLLDDAELIEADHLRLHESEQRLVQADIDLLSLAVPVIAVVDREHR